MANSIYNSFYPIPLSFIRCNGSLVTGLSVTVKVVNASSGATLLNTTAVPEVSPGVYFYNWNHSIHATTECIAQYVVAGRTYCENITIDSSFEDVDQESQAI